MNIKVKLALDKLVIVTLEFSAQDTLSIDMHINSMVAETLASPTEMAILVPNVIVEKETIVRGAFRQLSCTEQRGHLLRCWFFRRSQTKTLMSSQPKWPCQNTTNLDHDARRTRSLVQAVQQNNTTVQKSTNTNGSATENESCKLRMGEKCEDSNETRHTVMKWAWKSSLFSCSYSHCKYEHYELLSVSW